MYTTDAAPTGGDMGFEETGDYVFVRDRDRDDLYVRLDVWNVSKGQFEYTIWAKGEGDVKLVQASMGQPWNLAEGDYIRFDICLYNRFTGNYGGCNTKTWLNNNS